MTTVLSIAITVFLLVIAPIWIGAHYLTRWRLAKSLSPADEDRLAQMWSIAERLEDRLDVIERILEDDIDGADNNDRRKQERTT